MKTIVIIGGSKGIGAAILKSHVSADNVINISRSVPEISHPNLSHYSLDVLKDALPDIEKIDQLVYCPGSINLKPITRLSTEDFKQDFEINVLGAVKVIQKYILALKKSETASVVLFSTVATKLGMPFHASVAVSKSGVEGLVKSLAAEYASKIRFNAVAPTVTDTELAAKILRNDKMKALMIERHPLKKYLASEEVASMANYLLSEESKSISGQIFQLDCGITSLKI